MRRLVALCRHLPPEAVSRDQPDWTIDQELAAQQVEATAEVARLLIAFMRMWADPKVRHRIKIPDPIIVPRPESVTAAKRAAREQADTSWPPTINISGRDLARRLVG